MDREEGMGGGGKQTIGENLDYFALVFFPNNEVDADS